MSLGCLLLSLQARAQAVPLADEFVEPDTEERELYRSSGRLFEAENFPAAAKGYRDFLRRFPRDPAAPDAQAMLAESLYRQALKENAGEKAGSDKIFREAAAEFEKAVRDIPKGDHLAAGAEFRLAEIDFNQRRYAPAVERVERLLAAHPGGMLRGEARLLQGQALLALGQAKEAHRVLRAALADQPVYQDEPRMALAYGVALYEVGSSSEALGYLERLDLPLASLYAARAYLRLGKPLVAIGRLRHVLQKDPHGGLAELSQYLMAESFFAAKDFLSALQAYEQFLRLYPRSPYRPGATYKIGLCQYERQDYLAARGSFQSVLQLSPKSEFAELSLYMVGESFLKEGRLKEANLAYADLAASFKSELAGAGYFKQGWTHYRQGELPAAETALRMMLERHPAHRLAPAAGLLIGNVLTRRERYADAVRAYQQALDALPGNRLEDERKTELREACLALLNRANLLAKDYARLVSGYQYVLKHVKPTLQPWRAATLIYIAEGYYRQGMYDQALALYREVINGFPASPEAALAADGVAWALFAKGDYAASERERSKLAGYKARPPVAAGKTILEKGSVDEAVFINSEFEAATARFNQKQYLEALDAYELFERSHPQHPLASEAALQAGWCYYRLEHYGQALKAWERVEASYAGTPAGARAAWAIADTYFRAAHYDKAVAAYTRILQAYPGDPAAAHARVRIAQSHYNAKDVLKAIAAFEAIALEAPESPEAAQVLDFLTQLLFLADSKSHALEALNRLAEAKPGSAFAAQARFRVARHLLESGDHAGAVGHLEQLISRLSGKGELMEAQFLLAECYYQLKNWRDAALAYERFTANYAGDKRFAAALFHLGAARFKTEDFAGAAEAFSRLAKEFPDTQFAPVALFNSALAYRKTGKWEEAALALRTYMSRHPEEAKTSNAVTELAALYDEHRQYGHLVELLKEQREGLPKDDARRLELTHRLAEAYAAQEDEARAVEEYKAAAASPLRSNSFRLAALAKLGERYERDQKWSEALEVYLDLSRSATDPAWAEASKARAEALRGKLGQAAAPAAKPAVTDAPAEKPRPKPAPKPSPKKKEGKRP